ncbi:MAG: TldD/PmbA family protein [Bacillota bacterium]
MNFEEFRDRLFAEALRKGCEAAETFGVEGENFSVSVLDGQIDRYSVSRSASVGLRVQSGGKNGYAYTEVYEEPETLVGQAVDNARCIEIGDEHPMQTPQRYQSIENPHDPLGELTEAQKISLALKMERAALDFDPRVKRVNHCQIATRSSRVRIHNTLGLAAENQSNLGYCLVQAVVAEGEEHKSAFAFRMGAKGGEIEECAQEAAREAIAQLGASPVPAGTYRVVLRNDAAADILQAFVPMFSADMAQKGLSLLSGREGQTIAAPYLTIVDDPFVADFPSAFDDEGTPCEKKTLVDGGKLVTLLHNLKTAKKAGIRSTGNAGRASAASPVGVAPTNLFLLPGEQSFDEMVGELQDGLVVTEVSGLHAGVNTVSGEFSLLAKGLLVKGGKPVRPVARITIAGTFFGLMKGVLAIGSDLFFGLPGNGRIGSPSLLVDRLVVSGE